MSGDILRLGVDILVLICLGVTIYYALKLSKSMNRFRQYRKEFEKLIAELNKHIDRATAAADRLRTETTNAGHGLQDSIEEARLINEELQLMTEVGENLAVRLEKLAGKSRRAAQKQEEPGGDEEYDDMFLNHIRMLEREEGSSVNNDESSGPVFSIQDREYEAGGHPEDNDDEFQSQAEQELYKALQKEASG